MGDSSDSSDDSQSRRDWERTEIQSWWDWDEAKVDMPLGGSDADTSHLMLCRRRERKDGARFEPQLYVRKILSRKAGHGMKYVKREYDMLQKCEHRNILRYEDFAYSGRPWDDPNAKLFTEYCTKGDLHQFTATVGGRMRLNIEQGIQVFSQIAQALLYIHHGISLTLEGMPYMAEVHIPGVSGTRTQNGEWKTILHRDIKPRNVFVAEISARSIHVKLGDFEFARLDTNKSQSYVGTQDWLAPEQRHSNNNSNGHRRTTLKSDIYSFGLTMDAVMPQVGFRANSPSQGTSGIRDLITRCLQPQDTQRPTSVTIVDELRRVNVIRRQGSMVRDVASQHLSLPIAQLREPFWSHETFCKLCRRLLKAGGVGYVEEFDRVRTDRCQRLRRNERLPATPRSMGMIGLSRAQIHSVQFLRADGEDKETAIICVRAIAALRGVDVTFADGKEVASRVSKGASFDQAVARVRQRKLEEAQDDSEDEDSDSE